MVLEANAALNTQLNGLLVVGKVSENKSKKSGYILNVRDPVQ